MGKPWWSLVTPLGTFWVFLRPLGATLGTLGRHFGGLGTPLNTILEGLGHPWARPGPRTEKDTEN